MTKGAFFLLIILGFCAICQKAEAQITLGKPVLIAPSVSVVDAIEVIFCKLEEITTNNTMLYHLINQGKTENRTWDYSAYNKEEARFILFIKPNYDGKLMCKASVQNNSEINSTFSDWEDFKVLVPVQGAHIISSPSLEDLWEGDHLTLLCNITEGTYVSYEWKLNDRLLYSESSENQLTIQNLSRRNNGIYTCLAKNYLNETHDYISESNGIDVYINEAQITLGKPVLIAPSVSVVGSFEEIFCKLEEITTSNTILYHLINQGKTENRTWDYSARNKEEAKFILIIKPNYDGKLMCKASVQNNSEINSTFSDWEDFKVLVPVQGAHIISSPSLEDLWEGDNLTLLCNITEGTYVSYEWKLNDRLLYNESSENQLTIQNLSRWNNGIYTCLAKNYLNETHDYISESNGIDVYINEAQITLGKPVLIAPSVSVVDAIEEIFCKLEEITTSNIILYHLINQGKTENRTWDYSARNKEEAKFILISKPNYDGKLMCKASVQNNSEINSTFSDWEDFKVLVPVQGAHIISSPSLEDLWEGDHLTLLCNITEGTYVSYEWKLNDRLLHNESSENQLTIQNLSRRNNGIYTCLAKNYLNETHDYISESNGIDVYINEAQITLGKPVLIAPSVSVVGSFEEIFCKLEEITTSNIILYHLINQGKTENRTWDYSARNKEEAKFILISKPNYDGKLMCKASVQNNSEINSTFSDWEDFKVLVPVQGAHIISSPSLEDLWEGDNLTLLCNITEGTYVSYEWKLNDRLLHNESSENQLTIQNLSRRNNGIYTCLAKNYLNETHDYISESNGIDVYINEYLSNPEISFEVVKNADESFSTHVKCQVSSGSPPIKFTLFRNNTNVSVVISEDLNAIFVVPIELDKDMGTVYCQANNGGRPVQSKEQNLTVNHVDHHEHFSTENHHILLEPHVEENNTVLMEVEV